MFFEGIGLFQSYSGSNYLFLKHKKDMKSNLFVMLSAAACLFLATSPIDACTGITLKSKDGTTVVARTIEWGGTYLKSQYVIVPRGYTEQSYTPDGKDGMVFTTRYGYVGFAVEQKEFIAEGINEAGLSAGLFYFPHYGEYEKYEVSKKDKSISDFQLVAWLLGKCKNLDEVREAVKEVRIINIDPRASTVHWRFEDPSGRQLVLEIVDREIHFYENHLGVLTNSPGFEWQMTNLNNYVNLYPGTVPPHKLGNLELSSFGAGSGFLGIPGDVTPPSRFVRAAFYQITAPEQPTAQDAILQCFQILNNFDIPIGIEFAKGEIPVDIPSATQWTSATDNKNLIIYFRTMYDCTIRSINLHSIDFSAVKYQAKPMDVTKHQPIKELEIK